MNFLDLLWQSLPELLSGLRWTLEFSLLAIAASLVIGTFAALAKLSRNKILKATASIYVEIFRGTPLLVQILFIYTGLPIVLPLHEYFGSSYLIVAATTALGLNEGAYICEIIRAGIVSVHKGQKEAALSIGLSEAQAMRMIIAPQAFRRMIPPLVNQFAQTIKDTSLLAVISGTELIYTGQVLIAQTFLAFQFWIVIALIYFVIIYSLSFAARRLEKKLEIYKR